MHNHTYARITEYKYFGKYRGDFQFHFNSTGFIVIPFIVHISIAIAAVNFLILKMFIFDD